MFVDKAFIGVDGIHAEHGLTTNYPDQASIHRAMMRQARQRIVVADHRKIGVVGSSLIWPASDFHTLVTDKATSDRSIKPFAAKKHQRPTGMIRREHRDTEWGIGSNNEAIPIFPPHSVSPCPLATLRRLTCVHFGDKYAATCWIRQDTSSFIVLLS